MTPKHYLYGAILRLEGHAFRLLWGGRPAPKGTQP